MKPKKKLYKFNKKNIPRDCSIKMDSIFVVFRCLKKQITVDSLINRISLEANIIITWVA